MKCPKCGLDQDHKTRRCRCGYEFAAWKQGLYRDADQADIPGGFEGVAVLRPTAACLRSVWFGPRKTIGLIADWHPGYLYYLLATVYWTFVSLTIALIFRGEGYSPLALVGFCFLFGFLAGPLLFFVASYPGRLLFKILGGKGSARTIRTCLAWSSVPFIPALAILILLAVFGPEEIFTQYNYFNQFDHFNPPPAPHTGPWKAVDMSYKVVGEVLGAWSMVIFLMGVSVTEKISVPRVLLAFPLLMGISFVVFFVLGALSALWS